MKNRMKAPVLAAAAVFALSGCDILDVDNPNELVQSAVEQEASAAGLANGAEVRVADAVSRMWQGPEVASDNMFWVGSRDAWGALDNGFVDDALNEFTDGAFPSLGQATWMAQFAVELLAEHLANNPGVASFEKEFARAQLYKGIVMMVVAEIQEDMTFSNKMVDGAPVSSGQATIGPDAVANMDAVMGVAISSLTDALNRFNSLGETTLALQAQATRARAYSSRVIANNRTSVGGALAMPLAAADAAAVLGSGTVDGTDWTFNFAYSEGSVDCDMCSWINARKENTWDLSLVTLDAANNITGVSVLDPVSGATDAAFTSRLQQWKGGAVTDVGDEFNDLTISSERLLWSIVAENELFLGNTGNFEDAINEIRDDLDSETDFVSGDAAHGLTDLAFLQHTRRVNTVAMGLRLQDMYRWGLAPTAASDPAALWSSGSVAVLSPGTMLPITIIEVRANCHLNTSTCPGG